jgi:outer membrane protein OmpA-like peptidoglycan-associated protein
MIRGLPVSPTIGLLCAVGLAGPAAAQGVQMFDQPPPLDQLRAIIIPQSQPGLSRRIVVPPISVPPDSNVQQAASRAPVPSNAPAPSVPTPAATPEPAAASDAAPPAQPHASGVVAFRINFAFDSAAIAPSGVGFVERIGELLKSEPQLHLRIEGHTDAVGSNAYNQDLSVRRAAAVASYLESQMGIPADRLVVVGKGRSEPLVADPLAPANRRVQFSRAD